MRNLLRKTLRKTLWTRLVLLSLMLGSSGLVACAQNNFSTTTRVASNGNSLTSGNVGTGSSTCSAETVGKIYSASGSTSFESQVKSFISATMDPKEFGSISGDINASTGIDFSGKFIFSGGALTAASSSIAVTIYDSLVGSTDANGEVIAPYTISFSKASSGSLNSSTGAFSVVFQDSYGSITFSGTKGSTYSEGTVSYVNTTAVSGYTASSGTLGSFKVKNCVIF